MNTKGHALVTMMIRLAKTSPITSNRRRRRRDRSTSNRRSRGRDRSTSNRRSRGRDDQPVIDAAEVVIDQPLNTNTAREDVTDLSIMIDAVEDVTDLSYLQTQ